MTVDDSVGRVEAQARPLAHRFGGEERIEDLAGEVGGNARTVIADLDHDASPSRAGADGEDATPLHRIDRVVDQVGPHLIELATVRIDTGEVLVVIALHADTLLPFVTQDRQGVVETFMHVDLLDRSLVQIAIALDRLDDLGDRTRGRLRVGQQGTRFERGRQERRGRYAIVGRKSLKHRPRRVGAETRIGEHRRELPRVIDAQRLQRVANRLLPLPVLVVIEGVCRRRRMSVRRGRSFGTPIGAVGQLLQRIERFGLRARRRECDQRSGRGIERLSKLADGSRHRRRGIVQFVGQACGHGAERGKLPVLLQRGLCGSESTCHGLDDRHRSGTTARHQSAKGILIDFEKPRVLDSRGGGRSWRGAQDRHFTDDLSGTANGQHVFACLELLGDLDVAFEHHVHRVSWIAFREESGPFCKLPYARHRQERFEVVIVHSLEERLTSDDGARRVAAAFRAHGARLPRAYARGICRRSA